MYCWVYSQKATIYRTWWTRHMDTVSVCTKLADVYSDLSSIFARCCCVCVCSLLRLDTHTRTRTVSELMFYLLSSFNIFCYIGFSGSTNVCVWTWAGELARKARKKLNCEMRREFYIHKCDQIYSCHPLFPPFSLTFCWFLLISPFRYHLFFLWMQMGWRLNRRAYCLVLWQWVLRIHTIRSSEQERKAKWTENERSRVAMI